MGIQPSPGAVTIPPTVLPNLFQTLSAPPGFPPDVFPLDLITSAHMNAVRDSAALWPGDVDAQGHTLKNVVLNRATISGPVDFDGNALTDVVIGPGAMLGGDLDAQGHGLRNVGTITLHAPTAPDTRSLEWRTGANARWNIFVNGSEEDLSIARYSDAGAYLDNPLMISRSTGTVSIPTLAANYLTAPTATLGAVAMTGDLNMGGHSILNAVIGPGSSIPWDSVTGKPANFQTPWAQDIQGAGFDLYNAGTAQFSQNHPPPSGAGVEVAYDGVGHVVAYDRTGAVYKEMRLYGSPLSLYAGGSAAITVATGNPVKFFADVDLGNYSLKNAGFILGSNVAAQLVAYNIYYDGGWKKQQDGPGLAIIKYPGGAASSIYTSPTVTGATVPNPTAAMIFRDDGVIEIPRNIVGSDARFGGYVESAVEKGFAGNLYFDGTNFRYRAAGAAVLLFTSNPSGAFPAIYTAPHGSAGAVANIEETIRFLGSGVVDFPRTVGAIMNRLAFYSGARLKIDLDGNGLWGTGIEPNASYTQMAAGLNHRWYQGTADGASASMELTGGGVLRMKNQNGERIRVYDSGGINHAIGIEANCMWQQCATNSVFRWYCGVAPDGNNFTMQVDPGHLMIKTPGTEADIDFYIWTAGVDTKRSRISASAGSVGFQTLNDAYSAVLSTFSLTTDSCRSSVPIVGRANVGANLDAAAGAAWSWYLYAISNTQIAIRIRGNDGTYRQVVLNVA